MLAGRRYTFAVRAAHDHLTIANTLPTAVSYVYVVRTSVNQALYPDRLSDAVYVWDWITSIVPEYKYVRTAALSFLLCMAERIE